MAYCTSCGAEIVPSQKFCELCGAPVEAPDAEYEITTPSAVPSLSFGGEEHLSQEPLQDRIARAGTLSPGTAPEPKELPSLSKKSSPGMARFWSKKTAGIFFIAVIVIASIVAAELFIVVPFLNEGTGSENSGTDTATPYTETTAPASTPEETVITPAPTPTADPYSAIALPIKTMFSFNEGKYASRATVYRYWINGTYQWHNDYDNKYYTQKPKAGNKYLFVYVVLVNDGSAAYPYPKSRSVYVHHDGKVYSPDPNHYLPDRSGGDRDASPVEILEIQQQHDYFNSEYVEDYGYSHGTTSDFVSPGQSNAIDGYITYEVPEALSPEKTYVEIVFDSEASAVWRLA